MKHYVMASAAVLLAACTTYTERVDPADVRFEKPAPSADQTDPSSTDPRRITRESFAPFVEALRRKAPEGASVGFLPLACYDLRRNGPFVSDLAMLVPDELCRQVESDGVRRTLLAPRDMEGRIADSNLARSELFARSSIELRAERMGVDVLVLGELRRERDVGRSGRDELRVEIVAIDVESRAVLARADATSYFSDVERNVRLYQLADRDGLWLSDSKWEVPEDERTLDRELAVAARVLARRAGSACSSARSTGAVYVAPTDTGNLVSQLAYLRAAQGAYNAELRRRSESAVRSGGQLDMTAPVTLVDGEFESMQAAEAFLKHLEEAARATPAMRFGEGLSARLRAELQQQPSGREVRDFGSAATADTQRASFVLATQGLAANPEARKALAGEGVGVVLAPRLEHVGSNWIVRVDVLDLGAQGSTPTKSFTLDSKFNQALQAELGLERIGVSVPVHEFVRERRESWERVFANAESGVVYIEGAGGAGTGFLATSAGHIVTSSKTAQSLGANAAVYFSDRSKHAFSVLRDDALWDIAVLKVDAPPAGARALEFADASAARAGAAVAVFGHPLGTSGWVISPGYLGSTTELETRAAGARQALLYNCPTREGNSGSPVLLADGRVVAVHSHAMPGAGKNSLDPQAFTGFAYGAPADEARAILASALAH